MLLLLIFDLAGSVTAAIGAVIAIILPGENRRRSSGRVERLTPKGKVAVILIFVGLVSVIGSKLETLRKEAQATEQASEKHRRLIEASNEAGDKIEGVSADLRSAEENMRYGQKALGVEINRLLGVSGSIADAVGDLREAVAHEQLLRERFEEFALSARIYDCDGTQNGRNYEVRISVKRGAFTEMTIHLRKWNESGKMPKFAACAIAFGRENGYSIVPYLREEDWFWHVTRDAGGTVITMDLRLDALGTDLKNGLEVHKLGDLVGTRVELEIDGLGRGDNIAARGAVNGLTRFDIHGSGDRTENDGSWKGCSSDLGEALAQRAQGGDSEGAGP